MNIKNFPDWESIYHSCGYAACELSLVIDWFEQMVDWCAENGQEFPLQYDEYKSNLTHALEWVKNVREHAQELVPREAIEPLWFGKKT